MKEKQTAKNFYNQFNFLIFKYLKKRAAINAVQLILHYSNSDLFEFYSNDNAISTDRFFYSEVINEIKNL